MINCSLAPIILPLSSIVMTGMNEDEPYIPEVTPVKDKLIIPELVILASPVIVTK